MSDARFDFSLGHGMKGVSARRNLGQAEVKSLINAIHDSSVLSWDAKYRNPGVLDGEHWELLARYPDGRAFKSEGSNNWPEGFDVLYEVLCDLGMMRRGESGCMIESL